MGRFFRISGILCCLYGIGILIYKGTGSWFNFVFLIGGAVLLLLGRSYKARRPGKGHLFGILHAIVIFLLTVFIAFEAVIIGYSFTTPDPGADYLILLGCEVRQTGPSLDLAARIDAASEYLKENPSTIVIASGGCGSGEPMSEAEACRKRLVSNGIESERILMEDRSTSTAENISFSADILKERGEDISSVRVVIVSSPYHLFRARYTALRAGFMRVSCKGGNGLFFLLPFFYTREFAAFVKLILFG